MSHEKVQELFPDSNLKVIPPDKIVLSILDQAKTAGIDPLEFMTKARKVSRAWPKEKLDLEPTLEQSLSAFSDKLNLGGVKPSSVYLCLLLVLHQQHQIRSALRQAVQEGDHVSVRKVLKGMILNSSDLLATPEEFLEGY